MDFFFLTKRYAFITFPKALVCLSRIAWFVFLAKDSFLHHFSTVTFLGVAVLVGSEFLSGTEIYPLMLFWHLGFIILIYSSWYLKIFWMGRYPTTKIYSFFCMWIGIFLIGYFWHFHWSETFKQWKKSVSFFVPILMWVSESHGDSVDMGALPVFIVHWLHVSFWLFFFSYFISLPMNLLL